MTKKLTKKQKEKYYRKLATIMLKPLFGKPLDYMGLGKKKHEFVYRKI